MSINNIANHVKENIEKKKKKLIKIYKIKSNDKRSYHINSDKIYEELHFKPLYNISDAVNELCVAFDKKKIKNPFKKKEYYNVETLLKKNIS